MNRLRYATLAMLVSLLGLAACGTMSMPGGATPAPESTPRIQNMAADQATSAAAPSVSATTLAMDTPVPTKTPVTTEMAEVAGAATAAPNRDTPSGSEQAQPTPSTAPTEMVQSTMDAPAEQHEITTGPAETTVTLVATRAPIAPIGPAPSSTALPEQPPIAAEDGQVVHLKVGELFEFKPGSGSGWMVKIGDEQIIAPVAGKPGSYKALAPGETSLVATRTPACRQAKPPCMLPTVVLHIMIVVQ